MNSIGFRDDIPKSHHSIFIRGFPATMDMRKIKDFFEKVSGHCSLDFFKTSLDKTLLYLAIRFDTNEVAKEIINRFNRKEVLGHIISLDWFKDIKRFHSYNSSRGMSNSVPFHSRGSGEFSNIRGNQSGRPFFRGRGRAGYNTSHFNQVLTPKSELTVRMRPNPPVYPSSSIRGTGRTQFYRKEMKRSRSPSSSRSRSRSRTRSRSYNGDERYRKTLRRRKHSRSFSSRSKSSRSRGSRSSCYDRTPERDRRTKISRDSSPEIMSRSRSSSKRTMKYYTQVESNKLDQLDDSSAKKHRSYYSTNPGPKKRYLIENKPDEGHNPNNVDWNQYNSYNMPTNVSHAVTPTSTKQFFSTAQHPFSLPPKLRYFQDANVAPMANEIAQEQISASDTSHIVTPPYTITQTNPIPKTRPLKPRSMSDIEKAVNNEYLSKRLPSEEKTNEQNVVNVPSDTRIDKIQEKSVAQHSVAERKNLSNISVSNGNINLNDNIKIVEKHQENKEIQNEKVDSQKRADINLEKNANNKVENVQQKNSSNANSSEKIQKKAPIQSNVLKEIAQISDLTVQKVLTEITPVLKKKSTAKDEKADSSNAQKLFKSCQLLSEQAKKVISTNDRRQKINDLKAEQLDMLQKKRQELEQAYRQDCETFATVVKMLISKDSSLEEKIVNSLRESLKDIGEKFIEELSNFIDDLLASQDN